MKTFKQILSEVARAQSPADKEFVALHPVDKKQFVRWPESQFKGTTKKDESKMAHPSNETGVEDEIKKEKPLGEEVLEEGTSVTFHHTGVAQHRETGKWHAFTGGNGDVHLKKGHDTPEAANEHGKTMHKSRTTAVHPTYPGHSKQYPYGQSSEGPSYFHNRKKLNHTTGHLQEDEQVTVLEGADSLMEISKKTLGSYIKKASSDLKVTAAAAARAPHLAKAADRDGDKDAGDKHMDLGFRAKEIADRREKGIHRATSKLVKEGKSYDQLKGELNEGVEGKTKVTYHDNRKHGYGTHYEIKTGDKHHILHHDMGYHVDSGHPDHAGGDDYDNHEHLHQAVAHLRKLGHDVHVNHFDHKALKGE